MSLPRSFLTRLETILTPEHFKHYLLLLNQEKLTTFRINTLKSTIDAIINKLLTLNIHPKPITWCPEAFFIEPKDRRVLTDLPETQEGSIYIQNAASLFAVMVLSPQPNEEVLDLTAAPGGKTLFIAQLMQNKGRLAAVEAVRERYYRLRENIKKAEASIVQTYCKDGAGVGRLVPNRFDRVLLDAPCSSEGRFNLQEPKSYAYWSEKKIVEMSRKQKQLIYSAVQALKPNGTLVYCTCSFAPEENEMIIDYALAKFKGMVEIVPFEVPFENFQPGLTHWQNLTLNENIRHAIRIIPNELMNGFFICKMRKLQ